MHEVDQEQMLKSIAVGGEYALFLHLYSEKKVDKRECIILHKVLLDSRKNKYPGPIIYTQRTQVCLPEF